jgi:excisionase family DNA binding protein
MTSPPKRSGRPGFGFVGAAEYTGFDERYLRRLVAEKRIPHMKMSPGRTGRIFFDPDKLDEWKETLAVPVESA